MKKDCFQFETRIADLAEGRHDEAALAHVGSCSDCAEHLRQLQIILAAAHEPWAAAPVELVATVKGLMTPQPRTVFARLLRTSALAGARAIPDDVQVVLDVEEASMRVMYARMDAQWEVMGKLPSSAWTVELNARPLSTDEDGRFSFAVPAVEATRFAVLHNDLRVEVPPLQELLSSGPSNPR